MTEKVTWLTTRQIDAMMPWQRGYCRYRERACTERTPSGARRTDPGMKVIQDFVRTAADHGWPIRRTEARPGSVRASGPMWLGVPGDDPAAVLRAFARTVLDANTVTMTDDEEKSTAVTATNGTENTTEDDQ